ncbi:hypothetical protein GM658_12640 [Pseudoduganella eburnea]|uniref:Uncharacterized protein n=1 Tax=Massilia eburnea TaxID=1776165 RepID=A0A6L6QGV4_9BURK|nr:hypothetical protein [Massilia eburnea]MTW11445.1 hypothetical protein [Massilia eburnea]
MNIITLISQIPATFWSGLFAAVLTLGGVLIANKDNTKRLRTQLDHDAEQKTKERTTTLRREVYMTAAEEMVKATHHLGNLPSVDLSKETLDGGLLGFARASAKMQLVAEPNTALLINKLSAAYAEAVVHLATLVTPILRHKGDIQMYDDFYKTSNGEVRRVLNLQTMFLESAQTDQVRFQALQQSFAGFQAQAEHMAAARSEAWSRHNAELAQFYRAMLEELRAIAPLQISVLVEIRRDLGLTTDLNAYRLEMENQWNRVVSNTEHSLQLLSESNAPEDGS